MSKASRTFTNAFYKVVKTILAPYFYIVQRVRFRRNGWDIPPSPALFLSNHQTNWDGLYVNVMFFRRKIHYIVHDEMFRTKALSFLSGKVLEEIKKSDKKSDFSAIKQTIQFKNMGRDIGIFPEGDIDMFGRGLTVDDSIGKLAKTLNIPVVLMRISGAHLRAPRWAMRPMRSRIYYDVVDVITVDELRAMSKEETYARIMAGISYDEAAYQSTARTRVLATRRAERLEYGLYYCPHCGSIETLYSKGNRIYCRACGFNAIYTRLCEFTSTYACCPRNTRDWDALATLALKERIASTDGDLILVADGISFAKARVGEFFDGYRETGKLYLYRDRLVYEGDSHLTLYYSELARNRLQYKATLEVGTEELKYRFEKKGKPYWSAYLYSTTIDLLSKAHE